PAGTRRSRAGQQRRARADGLPVALDAEPPRRAAGARLQPLDPRALVDDAGVGETRHHEVPVAPFGGSRVPDGDHVSPSPPSPRRTRASGSAHNAGTTSADSHARGL